LFFFFVSLKFEKSRPFWEKNEKKKVEKSRPFWGVTQNTQHQVLREMVCFFFLLIGSIN